MFPGEACPQTPLAACFAHFITLRQVEQSVKCTLEPKILDLPLRLCVEPWRRCNFSWAFCFFLTSLGRGSSLVQAFCQSCAHFDSHLSVNVMIRGFPTVTQMYKLNISHISQFFFWKEKWHRSYQAFQLSHCYIHSYLISITHSCKIERKICKSLVVFLHCHGISNHWTMNKNTWTATPRLEVCSSQQMQRISEKAYGYVSAVFEGFRKQTHSILITYSSVCLCTCSYGDISLYNSTCCLPCCIWTRDWPSISVLFELYWKRVLSSEL